MLKKTNIPHWYKNEDGAVINTNDAELQQYMTARNKLQKDKEHEKRFDELEDKVHSLDSKLDLILEKLSNG